MYLRIDKLKKETVVQYENHIDLFYDSICYHKLMVDQQKIPCLTQMNNLFRIFSINLRVSNFWLHFDLNLSVHKQVAHS